MLHSEPIQTIIRIRPHHGLCVQHYRGKGYSEAFVAHMSEIVAALNRSNSRVELVEGADDICSACPNCVDGVCQDEAKVRRFDSQVLALGLLHEGDVITARDFTRRLRHTIIYQGRMGEVCGDCEWAWICHR